MWARKSSAARVDISCSHQLTTRVYLNGSVTRPGGTVKDSCPEDTSCLGNAKIKIPKAPTFKKPNAGGQLSSYPLGNKVPQTSTRKQDLSIPNCCRNANPKSKEKSHPTCHNGHPQNLQILNAGNSQKERELPYAVGNDVLWPGPV